MTRAALAVLLLLSACSDYPRDTAGTGERVRGGVFRVGWAGGGADASHDRLLRDLASRTRSRPSVVAGSTEPLLVRLERGELDLVVGGFDRKTPWSKRVTFSRPLSSQDGEIESKAATRNGEHRWAMEVNRAVAAIAQAQP